MPTFATPGPITATVKVAGAQVRVTASDRTDTAVLVEPINRASQSDVKVANKTKVDFASGQLKVKTTASGDKNGSVAITIDLPAGSRLAANLAYSSVHADGPLGWCELHMASGRVRLDRIDALRANISAGEVAIDRADGSVTATTASGAIRIGRMTHGQAKLMNGSGNIEVGISEGTVASIDANSERGAVHNFVSSQGNSDPGDPKVMVHARTRHGDIIIQRASS